MYRCRLVAMSLMALSLVACIPTIKGVSHKDSAPIVKVDAGNITDAIPRRDIITRAGNKNPYTVLGKTYHLLPSSKGYKARGVASWYGTKFQGRPTANGELYNLYAMTAAHKTLLIPSYVKVTNLENGRTVVVRVNDRGPFHDDRIIDLSYAAAVKLGYADKGTVFVEVESIDVDSTSNKLSPIDEGEYFLQVAAFKSLKLATKLKMQLSTDFSQAVTIKTSEPLGYYQVHIGPLSQLDDVRHISEKLLAMGLGKAHLISN